MVDRTLLKEVLLLQNEQTELLANGMLENASLFQETLDFKHLITNIESIEQILLQNGIFLRELLDVLEETGYPCDN